MIGLRIAGVATAALLAGLVLGVVGQKAQASWDSDQAGRDHLIAKAPAQTEATLTAVQIDDDDHRNPNSLHYTFVVDGVPYTGADYSGEGGNPRYDQLHPGDVVHITYYKVNPRVSCACDPNADLNALLQIESSFGIAIGLGSAGVALLITLGVSMYRRSRRRT